MGKVASTIGGLFSSNTKSTTNAATPVANAFTQSQDAYANGGLNNILNQLLAGRPGDPNSLNQYFGKGINSTGMVTDPGQSNATFDPSQVNSAYNAQNVNGGFTPQNVNTQFNPAQLNGQYTPQQFQQAQLGGVQTGNAQQVDYNSPQFQQTQLQGVQTRPNYNQVNGAYNGPQYQQTQLQGPNTNIQTAPIQQLQGPNVNFQQGPDVTQGMGQQAQLQNIVNPAAQTDAMRAIMQHQQAGDIASLRERFGNQALSSGAQLAESNYLSQALPQQALALDQITRDNNAQALTQRGQDLSNFQGTQQNDTSRLGLGVNQAQGLNNSMLGLSAQGLQAGQGNQNADIASMNAKLQAAGLSNDAIAAFNQQMQTGGNQFNQFQQQNSQFGASQNLAAQQANQAAALQAMGLRNTATLGLNQQQLDASGQNNQFNLQNAQNQLQAGGMNQNALMQQQGLNNTATLGFNQQQLDQFNQLNQFNQGNAQFGATFGLNQGQQNVNNALNAAQYQQQGQNLNNQYAQASAAQQLQAALANQQNQQFGAQYQQQGQNLNNQYGLQAAQMNQNNQQFNTNAQFQNQGLGNQFNLGMQNVGLGQQGNQLNAQSLALQQMMQNLRQTQGLGTAQAENITTPGIGTQFLNAAGQVAGAVAAGGGFANMFGGNGQQMQMPTPQGYTMPQNLQTLQNPFGAQQYQNSFAPFANLMPQQQFQLQPLR